MKGKKKIFRILWLLSAVLLSYGSQSQTYTHNIINLGPEYELNGQFKLNYEYDQFGFLWMASPYGLDRYDGNEVLNISGLENFEGNDNISEMWPSPDTILWVLYSKNVISTTETTHRKVTGIKWVHAFTGQRLAEKEIFPNGPPFPISKIYSYSVQSDKLFIQTDDGNFYEFNESFKKIGQLENRLMHIMRWEVNNKGNIIFIDKDTINEYDGQGNLLRKKVFPGYVLYMIQKSYNNTYQVRGYNNPSKSVNLRIILNEHWEIIEESPLKKSELPFITKRKDGNYFNITEDKLQIVDESGKLLSELTELFGNEIKESKSSLDFSYQPEGENFAVLQTRTKPSIVYSFISPFRNYLNELGGQISARGICTSPDGTIFVNGLSTFFEIEAVNGENRKSPLNIPREFQGAESLGIYYDAKDSSIWSLSYNYITNYSTPSKEVSHFYSEDKSLNFTQVLRNKINKELLISSEKGIFTISSDCNCLRKKIIQDSTHTINQSKIEHIEEFEEFLILISDQEIFKWNPIDNSLESLIKYPASLKAISAMGYYMPDINQLYIATAGSGVIYWNLSSGKIKTIQKNDGLSSNVAYAIVPDDNGNFWISTTYGLNVYNPNNGNIQIFTKEDGLPDNEFNRLSFHKDAAGKLYFGGLSGITSFDPSATSLLNSEDPPTFLTELKIHSIIDSSFRILDFPFANQVDLSSDEILSIKFSSPNVRNTKLLKFQYKFENKNSEWQNHSGNSLVFSNLNSGTHLLKIRGPGHHKEWSSKEAVVEIVVPTPFFKSTLFYILSIVGITVFGFLYAKWRIFNLERSKQSLQKEVQKRTISIEKSKALIENQAAELQQLDKLKSQFFTNISHELRTPLTLINTPLYQLKKFDIDNPNYQKLLESVDVGSKELKRSIEKILLLSQLDSETMKVQNSTISFAEIRSYFIEPIQESIEHLQRTFQITCKNNPTDRILLDIVKLKEIIENLVYNSIKFTTTGAKINLAFGYENESFFFRCSDNGIGIPIKNQEKIFEKYFQSNREQIATQGGLGLGLPLSKAYAEAMDGHLRLLGSDENGTSFELKIPCELLSAQIPLEESIKKETPRLKESKNLQIQHSDCSQKSTILVVEDNNMMNLMLSNILKVNYNVRSAKNGLMALEILNNKKEKIDLVLTDWMMPEMDGPTFIDKLQGDSVLRNIPIIILSARATQSDKMSLFERGIQDYIVKPFDPDELKVRIQNLLERSLIANKENNSLNTEGKQFSNNFSADQRWIKNLEEKTIKCLELSNFSVSDLAQEMNLSERQLSRKLKSLLGLTPGNYLKEYRLLHAQHILQEQQYNTVSEVCYAVGFSTPDYFRKIFFERFGRLPSSYLKP